MEKAVIIGTSTLRVRDLGLKALKKEEKWSQKVLALWTANYYGTAAIGKESGSCDWRSIICEMRERMWDSI